MVESMEWWRIVLFGGVALLALEAQAQEDADAGVKALLNKIGQLAAEDYASGIEGLRTPVEKYIERKRRVCRGELSPVILHSESGQAQGPHGKGVDRKACFRELKALQMGFVEQTFAAREKYLNYLHQLRLGQLTRAKAKLVEALRKNSR